jgi:methylated-DNA-[protein]-cysteine S-methyltransferase
MNSHSQEILLSHRFLPSPVGRLCLVADEAALVAVLWENEPQGRIRLSHSQIAAQHPILQEAAQQIEAYFAGERRSFSLPLSTLPGTTFQKKVWQALVQIPYGETRSYGELAAIIDSPKASRAVGLANRRNPLSLIVPCHRVIGRNGSLTGFAGGLSAKTWLLDFERHMIGQTIIEAPALLGMSA